MAWKKVKDDFPKEGELVIVRRVCLYDWSYCKDEEGNTLPLRSYHNLTVAERKKYSVIPEIRPSISYFIGHALSEKICDDNGTHIEWYWQLEGLGRMSGPVGLFDEWREFKLPKRQGKKKWSKMDYLEYCSHNQVYFPKKELT